MLSIRLAATLMFSTNMIIATPAAAEQLYRFIDDNGTPTLSKTLPAEVSQQGYDILDEKSMRLIQRVPPALTASQIAEQQQEQALQREAEQAAQIAAENQRKQAIYDHNLKTMYQSEQDLLNARDHDLQHRENQLVMLKEKRRDFYQRLQQTQQQAAENELSGISLSENLKNRLQTAQQELANNQQSIEQLQTEINDLGQLYEMDLQRFRQLQNADPAAR